MLHEDCHGLVLQSYYREHQEKERSMVGVLHREKLNFYLKNIYSCIGCTSLTWSLYLPYNVEKDWLYNKMKIYLLIFKKWILCREVMKIPKNQIIHLVGDAVDILSNGENANQNRSRTSRHMDICMCVYPVRIC